MQAVILAAGEGARLHPVTSFVPKPLLPLAGTPLLVRIVDKLRAVERLDKVDKILVCVNAEFREQYEYHLKVYDRDVTVLDSPGPQGTAGELLHAKPLLEEEFLLYYGDIWTDLDIGHLLGEWDDYTRPRANVPPPLDPSLLGLMAVAQFLRVPKGIPSILEKNFIKEIREKPLLDIPNLCGVSVFNRRLLKYCAYGKDLNGECLPKALAAGERLYAFPFKEGYLDVGSVADLREADARFRGK